MLPFPLVMSLACFAAAATASTLPNAPRKIGKRCTGTIESLADVAAAEECTTINIAGFTVPAGQTFALAPPDGAVVSMTGQITFGVKNWAGPLMTVTGNSITFNGNNHNLVGNGDQYWDGQGIGGGVQKPDPMLRINMGGTFENVQLVNSPGRAVAIGGSSLTVSGVTVNNAAGAAANSKSAGKPAGANTDGFDVSANNVHIQNSIVTNQEPDDCLAINRGTNITFTGNSCTGGHGISIGSIASGVTVSGVTISNNVVTNNVQALRIKTDATATGSTVSNVVYSNNKATGTTSFGVLIDQSYPSTLGTPGTGVVINGVSFTGTNTISVASTGHRVEVNCGSTSSCTGTWNFAGLTVTGGTGSTVKNAPVSGGSF
ncbi:pectin lyase fold/virulence factor [Mycena pura]|uniref:endo-polygalacturonase n=1 Tax=Mycena pura TaxID=153505 RepID=A0AAD6YTM2_9AGAR|nr:pectin lyase fold/virulence factor [Mycena pura]